MNPLLSSHFSSRQPSAIRAAQIAFSQRTDDVRSINVAIGNVSLPMHPAMVERMKSLGMNGSPFDSGIVKYSATVGFEETNQAFLHIISASGFSVEKLVSQVTEGGSQAMELCILGTCDKDRPLLLLEAAYTNYTSMAKRLGIETLSVSRSLQGNGTFSMPDMQVLEELIKSKNPGALVVIPYDNPTGQYIDTSQMAELAQLCVKYNLWMISDEAYRELHYTTKPTSSVWALTDKIVPGIEGRRISIESTSKVWNACGLRIGAIVTDNNEYHKKSVAENTANLCPNVIGQYIFGAITQIPKEELQDWFKKQRAYYAPMLTKLTEELTELVPGIIISRPDASLYSVVDVRNLVDESFESADFVDYCATKGSVEIDGNQYTLLVSPMGGFYSQTENNPGRTQMRIAYVETPENMQKIPKLFATLFEEYTKSN
ncbi:aminotransferase class I/II-fold pyridoxal phosphate-dependent enzyme [Candidatus Dojkabacteria bacterium]|uniref:Aminotransferase class I/II-fold pyridoxal phosphate-dependent enzyme n=1 Tax=Candidatus Dojkabacteria bacterium TaxID=2099670 RepID=A0A955RKL0_9BACT|nr:aminotransferase class I/II-fold pyridoxal phosphate-dependent enzyme [Candidatus Dojkabacteria bacterium]